MIELTPMGQYEPISYPPVPEAICNPTDPMRKEFSFAHYAGTLRLTVPTYLEDKVMRSLAVKGYKLYDIYRLGMGTDYIPDAALRSCIKNALLYRYWDAEAAQWKSAAGNFTCMQYYHCFQEYTNAFQKHPAQDPLDRRMEIAENVFTPSPSEEKCVRAAMTTGGANTLLEAYQSCNCADIFPQWPGAVAFITEAIRNNPATNLYYVIKDHYTIFTTATTQPPSTMIPVSPVSPLPVSPGLVDPDMATLIKETQELKSRQAMITILAVGGGIALALMFMGK